MIVRAVAQHATTCLKLHAKVIKDDTNAEYLGATASTKGTNIDANIQSIRSARITGRKRKQLGLHSGFLTTSTLL